MTWREGLHRTAIGRCGGCAGVRRPRVGFPLWTADSLALYAQAERGQAEVEFIRYLPEHPCAVHETADWTLRTSELRFVEEGREQVEATIYDSQAWPARLILSHQNRLRLYGEKLWHSWLICPTRKGLHSLRRQARQVHPELPRQDWLYDRQRDGELREPWMLLAFGSLNSAILQLTFQRHPERVIQVARCLEFHFPQAAEAVIISAPYGIKTPPRGLAAELSAGSTWAELERQAGSACHQLIQETRAWAPRLLCYPRTIRDRYRFDEQHLYIQQSADHWRWNDNDWQIDPQPLLPIPPVLCRLLEKDVDHPLRITPEPEPYSLDVRYYRQRFVKAAAWTIRLPREHWVSHTLAPLSIQNDPRCEPIRKRMRQYLLAPNLTFHGDHTFQRTNVQDCFANYRATAPAAWAVDAPTRQALWEYIGVGVPNLQPEEFCELVEPVTGRTWLGQKDIWSNPHNTVDWDWYSGQLLAGVWNKIYYQGRDPAWLNRVFPILEGQFAYYRIYMDWAILSGWCDLQRNNRWLDGLFYAVQGLIGFARLARELGKIELAEEAEYYLLQHVALRDAVVRLKEYALECGVRPRLMPGLTAEDAIVKSVCDRESYGLLLDANVPCGNAALGIGVPEYLVAALSRPALRQELQHNNAVLLPRVLPHWNQRYTRDAQGRGPSETHPIDPSHSLFYLLYDYLIIEAWIMRAPLERLLELVHLDELAADILLLYLQATHPKLLIPTSAQFQGCSWDEAQQTLTLTLDVPPGTHPSLRLRLIHDRAPQQVTGAVLQPTAGVGIAYALCPGARQVIFQF